MRTAFYALEKGFSKPPDVAGHNMATFLGCKVNTDFSFMQISHSTFSYRKEALPREKVTIRNVYPQISDNQKQTLPKKTDYE